VGTIVWAADYLPFGQVEITVDTIENNLRFVGQIQDPETGLHYNYHRYYDPATGRYLTTDPIGLEGGINPYVYVRNNPINWVDPFGLFDPITATTISTGISSGFGVGAAEYAQPKSTQPIPNVFWNNSTLNPVTYLNALNWLAGDACENDKKKSIETGQDALDQLEGVEKAQKDYRDGKRERPVDFVDKSKQRFKSKIKNYKTPQDFYDDFD
jgi:RHS repeat-associated protein